MMKKENFKDYINTLRDNIEVLGDYHECLGRVPDPALSQIRRDLHDPDPFVVFSATVAAIMVLSDKQIYH
jgi:hypothetical protein